MKRPDFDRAVRRMQPGSKSVWWRPLVMCLACTGYATGSPAAAEASNFTFQGQNAALFPNTNPGNMSVFMNSVEKPSTNSSQTVNAASLIQQSIISQISSKIYNDIFKGTAASGYYDLGDGSAISYSRSGGYINVDITNPSTGTTSMTVLDQ